LPKIAVDRQSSAARMKILVTGAGGQVGLDLLRVLQARGDEVHASDIALPESSVSLTSPWHRLDVTDAPPCHALVAEVRPECVFHLAAILSARGEADPQRTYAVNQTGTLNVLEACRQQEVRQVIFTSTIAAFGPPLPEPVGDDVALNPTTMYGVTKVAGELLGATTAPATASTSGPSASPACSPRSCPAAAPATTPR
jgi:threonine 3-dehydrogenase